MLKRQSIYDALLLDIVCGVHRPGQMLDESALVALHHAGRAGVRDALARLAVDGLIDRRPRIGTFVADLGVIELEQVFGLRVQLESRAVALAAENATKTDRAAIKQAFAQVDAAMASRDFRKIVEMDRAFHTAIGAATHNRALARVTDVLNVSALRFWHYSLSRRPIAELRHEIDAHLRIGDAIDRADAEAAQAAMRSVLDRFPSTIKGVFDHSLQ